jgi:hypothetical protein
MLVNDEIFYLQQGPASLATNTVPLPTVTLPEFTGLITDQIPDEIMSSGDVYKHSAWVAMDLDDIFASIDWNEHSRSIDLANLVVAPCSQQERVPLSLVDHPFFLDTGATTHISPERSDFDSLVSITLRAVCGIGKSSIEAISIGNIHLIIGNNTKLNLKSVLYVPTATVRLMSVLAVNHQDHYVSHFGKHNCWITNQENAIVAHSVIEPQQNLY